MSKKNLPKNLTDNREEIDQIDQKLLNLIHERSKLVINAGKIKLTGKKWEQKKYIRYTGYPGGQRSLYANEQFEKNPDSIIEKAVKGMLPKNKLGANLFRNLHVYQDNEHNHIAQNPELIDLSKF